MRLNKLVKSIAIALPLMTLAACSSNDTTDEEAQIAANQAAAAEQAAAEEQAAQAAAAAEVARLEQIKAEEQDKLQASNTIYFDFDTSKLPSSVAELLDMHAAFLVANSNARVVVEGHADERGTPEYNIALGERRAQAVQKYLENSGVLPSQIETVSYGEEKPAVSDRTEAAFSKNRRAVLVY
ncbi:peptidoglycan-associated lipoprotein Pal [Thalassomonas sp. M1454]|uniref:peptidoglycan-associated lipoprotein Pal n=1 Tax=Thalassomonas sp. M1454 TaxID=2594477 RepID=UPI00117FE357|nr:peptidoglycan-associated lipoprotein Pal [Thalassomonas sp. M1454]TRX56374.1 peptidoglycan-associated lipoprotein Pal [Thalassomonas sp. M1454]